MSDKKIGNAYSDPDVRDALRSLIVSIDETETVKLTRRGFRKTSGAKAKAHDNSTHAMMGKTTEIRGGTSKRK